MATSPKHKDPRHSDSSSDDDSILNESSSTASEHDRSRRNVRRPFSIDHSVPNSSDTSTHSSPAHERNYHYRIQQQPSQQPALPPRIISLHEHGANSRNSSNATSHTPDLGKFNQGRKSQIQSQPLPQPPYAKVSTPQPPPPPSSQSQLLKQYQMNLPSPNRVNGSQSNQSHISAAEYINDVPPDRPERISSIKLQSVDKTASHLADVLQNLAPLNALTPQPDVTGSQSSNSQAELQSIGKLHRFFMHFHSNEVISR